VAQETADRDVAKLRVSQAAELLRTALANLPTATNERSTIGSPTPTPWLASGIGPSLRSCATTTAASISVRPCSARSWRRWLAGSPAISRRLRPPDSGGFPRRCRARRTTQSSPSSN
jgi:hypothetical protein